jgi:hypothetical protein
VTTTPAHHLRNTSRWLRKVRTVHSYEQDLTVPVSLCILLPDIQFVLFNAACLVLRSRSAVGSKEKDILIKIFVSL